MDTSVRLSARDSDALQEFACRVRATMADNVVALKLFGSKARGDDAPDSDLDVLVVLREAGWRAENRILDIAFDVNLAHDIYISPRVVAQAILDHPVWRITPFLRAVEREGVSL